MNKQTKTAGVKVKSKVKAGCTKMGDKWLCEDPAL